MDWTALYSMQQQLDNYIETQHKLTTQDLFNDKYLALLVELGELANETRCFKFWSSKPRSQQDVILEEYVDGIHFILSLGLEKGMQYTGNFIPQINNNETEQFNAVYEAAVSFKNNPDKLQYDALFQSYLQLGKLLGFNADSIQAAYLKKNEINYQRQDEGY